MPVTLLVPRGKWLHAKWIRGLLPRHGKTALADWVKSGQKTFYRTVQDPAYLGANALPKRSAHTGKIPRTAWPSCLLPAGQRAPYPYRQDGACRVASCLLPEGQRAPYHVCNSGPPPLPFNSKKRVYRDQSQYVHADRPDRRARNTWSTRRIL